MKLIMITKGNKEAGEPETFTEIYECDFFYTENQEDLENGLWIVYYKDGAKHYIDYDPEIDTIISTN